MKLLYAPRLRDGRGKPTAAGEDLQQIARPCAYLRWPMHMGKKQGKARN